MTDLLDDDELEKMLAQCDPRRVLTMRTSEIVTELAGVVGIQDKLAVLANEPELQPMLIQMGAFQRACADELDRRVPIVPKGIS